VEVFNPDIFPYLRDTDKRTKAVIKAIRDWWKEAHPPLKPLSGRSIDDLRAQENEGPFERKSDKPKHRLVPVDRVIAACELLCAKYSFHVLPNAWVDLIQSVLAGAALSQAEKWILLQTVVKKGSFIGAITQLFSSCLSAPIQQVWRERIQKDIIAAADELRTFFLPSQQKTPTFAGMTIPILGETKSAVLRKPPSSGAPVIGQDGKARGRKRQLHKVSTRHKWPTFAKRGRPNKGTGRGRGRGEKPKVFSPKDLAAGLGPVRQGHYLKAAMKAALK
jgi:hypothetical protein